MRRFWIGFMAVLLLAFAATPAFALDHREGSRIVVGAGETVNDDLILTGDTVVIEGNVDGDVFAFANNVQVKGNIKGNLVAAGNYVDLSGTVTGTAFTAANDIYVNGRVDGNLVSAAGTTNITNSALINRNWIAAGDRLQHDGQVGRDVLAGGSRITVNGKVDGEMEVGGGNLRIAPTGVVGGKVIFYSDRPATVENGARTGEVIFHRIEQSRFNTIDFTWFRTGWIAFRFIGFMLVGLLFLALFPGLRRSFPNLVLARPWQLPVAGIVTLVVFPVLVLLLMMTVVGIPLSVLSMLLFPALVYGGQILVSWSVASLLGERVEFMKGWTWPLLFLAGALLTTLVGMAPGIGWLFKTAFVLYGLGGVIFLMGRKKETPVA